MAALPLTVRKLVLGATLSNECNLSLLRGNALVLSKIIEEVDKDYYKKKIHSSSDSYMILLAGNIRSEGGVLAPGDLSSLINRRKTLEKKWGMTPCPPTLTFPPSQGININMMPFELYRCRQTLPSCLHAYIPIIMQCPFQQLFTENNKIAYLTIHESDVMPETTQRRAGLHIERPSNKISGRIVSPNYEDDTWYSLSWGLGYCKDGWPIDGIYMASNVSDSCAVYGCKVDEGVTNKHGQLPDCAREFCGSPRNLQAGELCWITDRTPHESLPLLEPVHRQFFRLVVGKIDTWYLRHNTPNPLGIQPDATIVDYDKFI